MCVGSPLGRITPAVLTAPSPAQPGAGRSAITSACFRFYGRLNDFLPASRKHRVFWHAVKGRPAVKDTLEALGVPHTEVSYLLASGRSVGFYYQLAPDEKAEVYPWDSRPPRPGLKPLLPREGPRVLKFVADVHLGKLARRLRLWGLDTVYRSHFPDPEIVAVALRQRRVVLTRDVDLLKHKQLRHGYWVRSTDPEKQWREILRRYPRVRGGRPFSRCLACNGRIAGVAKRTVADRLLPITARTYRRFYRCQACGRIYWRGSHYAKLRRRVKRQR